LGKLIGLDRGEASGSARSAEEFNKHVGNVHRNGYTLLRLARGRVFQMYLENIKTLLEDPRRSEAGTLIGGHDEEHDEELEAIQSVLPPKGSDGAEKSLLKSYVAWLRLSPPCCDLGIR
jgi:hypothetical protein